MKKLVILLLLFIGIKAFGQQTYWPTSAPPRSASYTQTIRIDTTAGVLDSLRNHYFSNGNKWNLYYTAAQANARFSGGGGGTTTNPLTLAYGFTGQPLSFNGASPITGKIDTSLIQTILNFFPKGDTRYAKIASLPVGANPTATAGASPVNGSALTFMRSDAAPKVDSAVFGTNTGNATKFLQLNYSPNQTVQHQVIWLADQYYNGIQHSFKFQQNFGGSPMRNKIEFLDSLGTTDNLVIWNTGDVIVGSSTDLGYKFGVNGTFSANSTVHLSGVAVGTPLSHLALNGSDNVVKDTVTYTPLYTGTYTYSSIFTANHTYTGVPTFSNGITLGTDLNLGTNNLIINNPTGAAMDIKGAATFHQDLNAQGNLYVSGNAFASDGSIFLSLLAGDARYAPILTLTTTGTSGAATYSGGVLNIPIYSGGGGGTVTSVSAGYGMSFTTITSTGSVKADSTVLQTVLGLNPAIAAFSNSRYARLGAANTFTGGFTSQYNGGSTYPFTSINNVGITNTTASGVGVTIQSNAVSWLTGGFVGSLTMTPTANRTVTLPDATTTLLGTATTAPVSNKTFLPANTFQTGLGTAGTDSLVVKTSGALKAISPTYYQVAGSYVTAIGVTTANGVSGSSSGGTTPNLTISLGNITPTTIVTTHKPTNVYQTPLGTAGTDSLVVKHSGGVLDAIDPGTYLLTANMVSAATASKGVLRTADADILMNSSTVGYTTTATSSGTTTLVSGSTEDQFFTGTLSHTVLMPVASTLNVGKKFRIVDLSSGASLSVQSSGANVIGALGQNQILILTCILNSGTGTASWSAQYGSVGATGIGGMVFASSPTLTAATLNGTTTGATLNITSLTSTATNALTATINVNTVGTALTNGFVYRNGTLATVGAPTQNSGLFDIRSHVWNTTATAADNQIDFALGVSGVTGANPTGNLDFYSSLTTGATPSYTKRMTLDNSGNLTMSTGTVILKGFTVAGLPTGVIGMTAYVTDALTPSFGTTLVGGGAIVTKAFYNGTNWIAE